MDLFNRPHQHSRVRGFLSNPFSKPSRLVYGEPTHGELADFLESEKTGKFKEKVQENYDKKITALSERIKTLEAANKSEREIKEELKKEKAKILKEAINQALKDLKIQRKVNGKTEQISYMQIANHSDPEIRKKIDAVYNDFDAKIGADIDKAVDEYIKQKTVASGKAKEGLQAIPPALTPTDLDAANAETARLQEVLDKRKGIVAKSKGERAELMPDRSEGYKARTSIADALTAPKGGIIDNYETDYKFWSKEVTNEKNPTRYRLQGFLYANDIFAGGGAAGQQAMNEAIKEPRKFYVDHWPDKLTVEDLESGMAMKSYFENAKQYSSFERVIGTIAGLERLADKNIGKPELLKRYKEYLKEKFAELKAQDKVHNEEKQLQHLYSLKSLAEFIGATSNWRADFSKFDQMTDPDAPGAKITDYPGTFSDNKNNKTRWNLNGYLYSVYLFKGKSQPAANAEFERAVTMYKKSGLIDEDFTQEMIEKPREGKKDGFGLGPYLREAEGYTTHEQVKGVIAGLLKQADEISDSAKSKAYRTYLESKLKGFSPDDSEDVQMTILSTVVSPEESEKEQRVDKHTEIMEAVIEATKQHNQLQLEKKFKEKLEKDPLAQSLDDLKKLGAEIKTELDSFTKNRADIALKTMQTKYDTLVANNGKLKTPLYDAASLNPLAKLIEDNAKEFAKAKAIQKEGDLKKAVDEKYLTKLTEAEKNYFNISEQLDAKLKAVQDQATAKAPDQEKIPNTVPVSGGGSKVEPGGDKPSEDDPYKAGWESAPRVEPHIKDYQGVLIADSTNPNEKVIARDWKGNKVAELSNGTELVRTEKDSKIPARRVEYLNFIRVHRSNDLNNHGLWIPEEQLFKREEYNSTPAATTPENTTPAEKTPEKPADKPKFMANQMDAIFNRVSQEVETNSYGSAFDITYNGQPVGCRVQKLPDGYHLTFNSAEAGTGDIRFNNVTEIYYYFERGNFYQRLAMQTIMSRSNWDRYKSGDWFDQVVDFKRTGDWTMFVELDWKRNNLFEKGNAKIDLSVGADGRINYKIRKDHVGPQGENERTGFVSDFIQLAQVINHCKIWSENYIDNKEKPEFPAMLTREKLLYDLMDARTFEGRASQIGEKYYFNHFDHFGYGYMYLNWDNQSDLVQRNRSVNNPILEYKLNPDNSINWKLLNMSGPNGSWVGTQGRARDISDLCAQVAEVKKDPSAKMTTPGQNLYNLGGLGYALFY